jgi:putative protease
LEPPAAARLLPGDPQVPKFQEMKKPELLAPGGSFLAAYYAFQAGADGVYLGMKEFSARQGAANFSLEQLRRILGVARERGGKVYLALNTVVREQELERAAEMLFWAEGLGLDGVIVQDLGIYELARRRFPALPLHASTQMAVHNDSGLRVAREMGFRRVILARELDFESIRRLRAENPGIELEVFIHGALCYSFSGLCLASWALTGRSGNRGDCAQICRSLFRSGDGEGYCFSCRDLFLGMEVRRLMEIGIDAFKIEGRMKSPEYVYHTVRLYRAIIDRGQDIPAGELAELERNAALGFARKRTQAYFRDLKGEGLLDPEFPGHRGAVLAAVEAVRGEAAEVLLEADLSLRDGLLYFPPTGARDPFLFSVRRILKNGREVPFARRGERVQIQLPESNAAQRPVPGTPLYQLSSRFLDLPQPKEGGFRPYRIPCRTQIVLAEPAVREPGHESIKGGAELEVTVSCSLFPAPFRWTTPLPVERAKGSRPFAPVVTGLFREAGNCTLEADEVTFINRTGLEDEAIFVPPSVLKKAKNAFYLALERAFEQERLRRLESAAGDRWPQPRPQGRHQASPSLLAAVAQRGELAPRSEDSGPPHPFVDPSRPLDLRELAEIEGWRFLPLPPVARSREEEARRNLTELVTAHPEQRFAVGLSNLGHLSLARELGEMANVAIFVDFYLYAANRFAVEFLRRQSANLLFIYYWLEGGEEDSRALCDALDGEVPLVRITGDFRPPLFYGMSCPRAQGALPSMEQAGGEEIRRAAGGHGALPGSEPPASPCRDCPGGFTLPLTQGRNRFLLRVRDCSAYLYRLR